MDHVIRRPDLSSRPDSSLEWWFVQGFVEGRGLGRRDFMLSFFRQSAGDGGADGHMLLVAALDPATGHHAAATSVSPALVGNFVRRAPGSVPVDAAAHRLVADYIEEIETSGPPRPVVVCDAPVVAGEASFAMGWADFLLSADGSDIALAFTLPGGEGAVSLVLDPVASWFEGRGLGAAATDRTMAYDCCPRVAARGTIAGEEVTGEAWIDHQWGGHGWLREAGGGLLGWDWLGISLDDGRDILALVHRDMAAGTALGGFAVLFAPGRRPHRADDVAILPGGEWTSPATMIAYPLRPRLEIPSLGILLSFEPSAEDQEIPVFGPAGAIWEGAGRVAGTVGGIPVAGRARLELNGYGYPIDRKAWLGRWGRRIEATLEAFLPRKLDEAALVTFAGRPRWGYDAPAQTAMLSRPVWDLLDRGGKHWRPVFGLLLLDALGAPAAPYERMFSVIGELAHSGSVIIDDIEDASTTRRGEPAIHLRHGLPAAINAGNLLYFLPLLTVAETAELALDQREAIYRIVYERFVQAHLGQAQDLFWADSRPSGLGFWDDPRLGDLILQAYAFKTAAPVMAIADVAAVIARPPEDVRAATRRLAESAGVAFQIVDDVNNFASGPGWGKATAEDLAAGKVTYVLHRAVRALAGAEKARLVSILDTPALRQPGADLEEGIGLVRRSGALAACRDEAETLARGDWRAFSRLLPASHAKLMLRMLLAHLLALSYGT